MFTALSSADLLGWVRRWADRRAGARALAGLDDRMLSDLGVSRSDIDRVAWYGLDRAILAADPANDRASQASWLRRAD